MISRFNIRVASKFTVFLMSTLFTMSTLSLTELSEDEMSDISGQVSLIDIEKYDFAGNNF